GLTLGGSGIAIGTSAGQSVAVSVSGGAVLGAAQGATSYGASISGAGSEATFSDTVLGGHDTALVFSEGARVTLERSTAAGDGYGANLSGASLTAARSRITGVTGPGIIASSNNDQPTTVSLTDTLVTGGGDTNISGAVTLWSQSSGPAMSLHAVGSTLIADQASNAALNLKRALNT